MPPAGNGKAIAISYVQFRAVARNWTNAGGEQDKSKSRKVVVVDMLYSNEVTLTWSVSKITLGKIPIRTILVFYGL